VLNLRQVQCFVLAVDRGTMTAAADALRVSQSAISLSIAGLENEVGAQLLIRRRAQGLALTPAGRRFLPQAKELLAQAEDVRLDIQSQGRELTGQLRVGCFRTAAPFVLPGLLETFAVRHPHVQLDFIEGPLGELERALLDGHCELALVYDLDVGPGIVCERIYRSEPYVLLSPEHPLAASGRPVSLADLVGEELVLLDVPPSAAYLLSVFRGAGLVPRVRYRVSSLELVRSLVGRNLGYALVISRPVSDVSYEGRPLAVRQIKDSIEPTDFSLAWTQGVRRTRRALAFAEHCRHMLPDRLSTGAYRARVAAS